LKYISNAFFAVVAALLLIMLSGDFIPERKHHQEMLF